MFHQKNGISKWSNYPRDEETLFFVAEVKTIGSRQTPATVLS